MPFSRNARAVRSRQRALIRVLWPLAFSAGLFTLSSIPFGTDADEAVPLLTVFAWVVPSVQNFLHVPAFAILAWLWFRALEPLAIPLSIMLVAGVGLTLGYALVDEWRQAYVPGRYPSATDVVADGIGALIAALIYQARYGVDRR